MGGRTCCFTDSGRPRLQKALPLQAKSFFPSKLDGSLNPHFADGVKRISFTAPPPSAGGRAAAPLSSLLRRAVRLGHLKKGSRGIVSPQKQQAE